MEEWEDELEPFVVEGVGSFESEASMIEDVTVEELEEALQNGEAGLLRLVEVMTPLIQVRAARALLRRQLAVGSRGVRQDVEDMVQEVLLALFDDGGKVLRNWQPERGLSFANYVGLVTERRVASILRSGKKTWREDIIPNEDLDRSSHEVGAEQRTAARETLQFLFTALRRDLSDQGWEMFQLLFVQERSVAQIQQETGQSADSIYAWRSRLRRRARKLMEAIETEIGSLRRSSEREAN